MTSNADILLAHLLSGGDLPDLLLEDRLSFLAQKHANISTDHDLLAQHKTPEAIINHFAQADPTTGKAYTPHIMNWYAKKQIRQEDAPRIQLVLKNFHANKHLLPVQQRDIGGKSLSDVEQSVKDIADAPEKIPWASSNKDNKAVAEGSEKILDTPTLAVRRVKTHDAMRALGSGTSWCVVPDFGVFHDYSRKGPLYHIHDKVEGKRYLAHAPTEQLMNARDTSVDALKLHQKHPDLIVVPHIAAEVAHRSSDANVLTKLTDHPDRSVIEALAGNRNAPQHVLDKLASHPNKYVVSRVSENAATGSHTLSRLADHNQSYVRYSVAAHNNTSPEILEKLSHDPEYDVVRRVARNKNTPEHVLGRFSNDRDVRGRDLRGPLAANPNASSGVLHNVAMSFSKEELQRDNYGKEDGEIHQDLAMHPNSSGKTLEHLAQSSDWDVLQQVAHHPNTPEHVRNMLQRHPDKELRIHISRGAHRVLGPPPHDR